MNRLLKKKLTEICTAGEDEGVMLSLVFKTGQMVSGAVRVALREEDDVMFELATGGEVATDPQGRDRKPMMFRMFFEIDVIERFVLVEPIEAPRVMSAGGLVIPRSS